jgi:hypothetical protein
MIKSVLRNGTHESLREFHNKILFLGMMHFQDPYNIDLERVQRCGIHYATPDGRIIPFCTYNMIYRQEIESTMMGQTLDNTLLSLTGDKMIL